MKFRECDNQRMRMLGKYKIANNKNANFAVWSDCCHSVHFFHSKGRSLNICSELHNDTTNQVAFIVLIVIVFVSVAKGTPCKYIEKNKSVKSSNGCYNLVSAYETRE